MDPTRELILSPSPFGEDETFGDTEAEDTFVSFKKFVLSRSFHFSEPPTLVLNPNSTESPRLIDSYLPVQIEATGEGIGEAKRSLGDEKFYECRNLMNPFECINQSIFDNRAAMKLASVDAVFSLTVSVPDEGDAFDRIAAAKSIPQQSEEPFTFADLAGGPGSFTQYLLWRRPKAKGWGITLLLPPAERRGPRQEYGCTGEKLPPKEERPRRGRPLRGRGRGGRSQGEEEKKSPPYGKNDWYPKLVEGKNFTPIYGPKGEVPKELQTYLKRKQGNGDITIEENGRAFIEQTVRESKGGVDLVVADAGEDTEGLKEVPSRRLIFCEILLALGVCKRGGKFVCKIFDLFTRFSMDMILLLATRFNRVTIFKPITSRPANGEKYVVCLDYLGPDPKLLDSLFAINKSFPTVNPSSIFESVPSEFEKWYSFMNSLITSKQNKALRDLLNCLQGQSSKARPERSEAREQPTYNIELVPYLWMVPERQRLLRKTRKTEKHIGIPSVEVFPPGAFVPRVLTRDFPSLEYSSRDERQILAHVVEIGQRKLFISELEFFLNYGGEKETVVYAGAAPGTHIALLVELFPGYKFILYDPRDFSERLQDPKFKSRVTIKQDFFTEEEAKKYSGQKVLFISDIRTADHTVMGEEKNEKAIIDDAELQKRLHKAINSKKSLLKNRLPYPPKGSKPSLESKDPRISFSNLKGTVYFQAWAKKSSTETRLVPDGLEEEVQSTHKYQDQMYYFNTKTRLSSFPREEHKRINGAGFDDCYDCSIEKKVLSDYVFKYERGERKWQKRVFDHSRDLSTVTKDLETVTENFTGADVRMHFCGLSDEVVPFGAHNPSSTVYALRSVLSLSDISALS